ncbi:hypothetical protein TOTORO_00690 [Serratia phage vB_SmaS-Totoro]|nr:hypothetical protein TOTORO_00690 [Serratia phage vB_SmaS-Totoro]
MTTPSLKRVKLDVPSFWRQGDLDRIARALNKRKAVIGETNPVFVTQDRDRFYQIKNPTHQLSNFTTSDMKLMADVTILDPDVLLRLNSNVKFSIRPRRNNDVFIKDGSIDQDAPGLVTFDFKF